MSAHEQGRNDTSESWNPPFAKQLWQRRANTCPLGSPLNAVQGVGAEWHGTHGTSLSMAPLPASSCGGGSSWMRLWAGTLSSHKKKWQHFNKTPWTHFSYWKKPTQFNLFTEIRHSKDAHSVQNPVSLCKIKNSLLEVFRQPQHLVRRSSKQQTCRKHLLYSNNFISFLFLLYSPREDVLVMESKCHRRALSVNWKLPGFLSVSVVSLPCRVFWTTKVSV